MKKCEICEFLLENDLFATVANEPVCVICKAKFIGGLPTTKDRINQARAKLGLADGEFLRQNNAKEARKILGRG